MSIDPPCEVSRIQKVNNSNKSKEFCSEPDRTGCPAIGCQEQAPELMEVNLCSINSSIISTREEIIAMQKTDKRLGTLIKWLRDKRGEDWIRKNSTNLGRYSKLVESLANLKLKKSILYMNEVPVIPNEKFYYLVSRFHVGTGHMGKHKLILALKDYYFSLECTKVVSKVTRECVVCQKFKGCARGGEPLCKRRAEKPYDQYAIDLLELEPAEGGARYLLVGVDMCSRFMHAIPIKDKKALTVCSALEQRVFPSLVKIPNIIISDNGPEFKSQVFEQLLSKYSIKHYTTIPYLPQTNGRVERLNRTLQLLLSTACAESGKPWIRELPHVLTMYNHSKHSQTGKTPSEFFCDKRKLPLPSEEPWKKPTSRFKPYKLGELVGYKIPAYAKSGKLSERYQGPCRVVEVDKAGVTYDIQCKEEIKRKKAHYKQLKTWYGSWDADNKPPITDKAPEVSGRDYKEVISVEDQLKLTVNFADMFRGLDFDEIQFPNESIPSINSPVTVVEVGGTLATSVMDEPGASLSQRTVEENDLHEDEIVLPGPSASSPHERVQSQPAREREYSPQSPQMLTRAKRLLRETQRLRTRSEPALMEPSFLGFDYSTVRDSSTPHQLNVLRYLLTVEPGNISDESLTEKSSESQGECLNRSEFCSTCGTDLHEHCNCNEENV